MAIPGSLARLARVASRSQLALGVSLARRGVLSGISLAIGGATTVALMGLAASYAKRLDAPVDAVPGLAASALAWGAGFLLAFSASARVLRRDTKDGLRHLHRARGLGSLPYLFTRVGGLAALLAIVVAGGTALVGLAALVAGARVGALGRVAHATGAAVVYALAFSLVIAPLAIAAVGARSRMGGYFFLAVVLFAPDLAVDWLDAMLPPGAAELFAIPSALSALRTALAPGSVDGLRAARAAVALALFGALALALVARELRTVDRDTEAP